MERDQAIRANSRVGDAIGWVQTALRNLNEVPEGFESNATREALAALELAEMTLYQDQAERASKLAAINIPGSLALALRVS